MGDPLSASQILDREFLEIRAKILEIGSSLDRIQRASGSVEDDRRMELIHRGIQILHESTGNRAEQIQLLFSRQYESGWREDFDISSRF